MSSIIKGVVLVVPMVCNNYRHDVRWLLALFPVPCQQHGGVLMEVRVILENENNEDKMTIVSDIPSTGFLYAFIRFYNG